MTAPVKIEKMGHRARGTAAERETGIMTKTYMLEADAERQVARISVLLPNYDYAVVPSPKVGRAWAVRVGHSFWQEEDGSPSYLTFSTVEALEMWAKEALGLRTSDPLPSAVTAS